MIFLGRDPTQGKWLEWQIQAYIVQEARREGYFIEGDQNQAKRGYGAANRAKVCGMQAGTPDIRVLIFPKKIVFIELKKTNNGLSQDQIEWHDIAKWHGIKTYVVYADTPDEGWHQVKIILTQAGHVKLI